MLTRIWLTPPLAIARVGGSPTPSDAFMWGHSDLTPEGTGRTTLGLAETINLDPDGTPVGVRNDRIVFRDDQGIRPVCPYFELHGTWREGGKDKSGQVTAALLDRFGIKLRDIVWSVHCVQLKAFHYTYSEDDRIDAVVQMRGNDTTRRTLEGRSPAAATRPLVPKRAFVPLGAVQLARPSVEYPEIRMRFYAPPGHTYGPTNIDQRIKHANFKLSENIEWRSLRLPPERKILNPKSRWATYVLEQSTLGPFHGTDARNYPQPFRDTDARNYPNFLFAFLTVGKNENDAEHHALGLVDDVSDGIISCTVTSRGRKLNAQARVVVGPPDFGPASRPPISLADNLADRVERAEARKKSTWEDDELRDIVHDIFERAFETSDLINKDYQNWRCRAENLGTLHDLGKTSPYDLDAVEGMLWADINANLTAIKAGKASASQLSEGGERKHRRYAAVEYLEMRLRENPDLFDSWIRRPLDTNPYFDTRMPALMRGSDSRPWHLTRRQWELVRLWKDRLEAERPRRAATSAKSVKSSGSVKAAASARQKRRS
jgi:hypothetical protein